MNPNVTVTLTHAAATGEATGRGEDGRIVFVADAIPGETVEVEIVAEAKRWRRGILRKVLAASSDRVEAPCPHFGPRHPVLLGDGGLLNSDWQRAGCGGCQWQQIDYERQLALKREIVVDMVARQGRPGKTPAESRQIAEQLVAEVIAIGAPIAEGQEEGQEEAASLLAYGFRTQMQFGMAESGHLTLATREGEQLPVETCLLHHPRLADIFAGFQLDGGKLDGGKLDGGKLDGGKLEGGKLDGGKLDGGKLDGDKLDGGKLDGGKLVGDNLDGDNGERGERGEEQGERKRFSVNGVTLAAGGAGDPPGDAAKGALIFHSSSDDPPGLELDLPVNVFWLHEDGDPTLELLVGNWEHLLEVDGRRLIAYPPVGEQVGKGHLLADEVVAAVATELLELKPFTNLLELWAGNGARATLLAEQAATVVAVEEEELAAAALRANLAEVENADTWHGEALAMVRKLRRADYRFDAALLSPPGGVIEPELFSLLTRMRIRRCCLVTDEPVRLARALNDVDEAGYRLAAVQPIDLQPHQAGVTVAVRFDRK